MNSLQSLDTTFAAIADPTRRAILSRLALKGSSVSDLARPFKVSLPAVSKHLRVLERAGLIVREKKGRVHHCRLDAGPMKEAAEWIARYRGFWEQRLNALAAFLEAENNTEENSWLPKKKKQRSKSSAPLRHRGKKYSVHGPKRNS
jgi:DNA-binding transcriptional ArsR family regulator